MKMPGESDQHSTALPLAVSDAAMPRRLMRDLREAHVGVRDAIALKLEVARAPDFTAGNCALVRWKMSRARHRRSKALLRVIVQLLDGASPAEALALRQLQLDELNVSRCCGVHLQRWTAETIILEREAYALAAAAFCGAVGDRLTREAEILYPMLFARITPAAYARGGPGSREALASSTVS